MRIFRGAGGRVEIKFGNLEDSALCGARTAAERVRRTIARFSAGRPTLMVFSTFIATMVTEDPGHPLSRVPFF